MKNAGKSLPAFALMVAASSGLAAAEAPPAEPERPLGAFERSPITLAIEEERALSAHEPMYFVVGGAGDESGDVIARFQISFKYRIFDPESFAARWLTPASNFYFAYTQTALWNWSDESAPFEDTSYRPSFFWQDLGSGEGLVPDLWRLGFEHASNGQSEERSRSVNTLFLRPAWWTELAGREFIFAPKVYTYLEKSDNPDIDEYRGNVEWLFRYGSESSWLIEAEIRGSSTDEGSVELSLSHPIRTPIFYRAGGFLYAQYFQGYGESLLDYDIEAEPTLRVGFAIVR